MRILYLVGGAKIAYGSEQIAMDIISSLTTKGFEFIVITANDGPVNSFCSKNNIENHVVPFKFYYYKKNANVLVNWIKKIVRRIQADVIDQIALKKINTIVDISQIDLIHSNLSRTMIGGRIAERYHIPHIWYLQEMYEGHYDLSPLMNHQVEWMNSHGTKFIAISNVVKNGWEDAGISPQKIERIYNSIDIESVLIRDHDPIEDGKIRIVMAGELCEAKGQHILLEAVNRKREFKNRIAIDFYGEGKQAYVEGLTKFAEKNHINLSIKGFTNKLNSLLCKYDIGVVCSKGEGFGLSTLQYMAAGLCVIVSNTGANEELIDSSLVGYVFERNNSDELSEILAEVCNHHQIIAQKGKMAHERAEKYFSKNRFIDSISEMYEKAIYSEH